MALKRDSTIDDGETTSRPAKAPKLLFTDTIIVLVGEEKQEYTVPHYFLAKDSPFFRAATSRRWQGKHGQASQMKVELADYTCHAFEGYLKLIVNHKISLTMDDEKGISPHAQLLGIYKVAHFVQNLAACNKAIDQWLEIDSNRGEFPDTDCVIEAARSLPIDSPMVRVCIAQLNGNGANPTRQRLINDPDCPPELIKQLLLHSWELAESQKSRFYECYHNEDRCYFHEHSDDCPPCEPE